MSDREKTAEKAAALWASFDQNERHGIRFGLFPAGKMLAAEREGFDHHALAVALIKCASRDGGMRA